MKAYLYTIGIIINVFLLLRFGFSSDVVTVRPIGFIIFILLGAIPFLMKKMRILDAMFFYVILFLASQGLTGWYVCSQSDCGMAGLFVLIPVYSGATLLIVWGIIVLLSRKKRAEEALSTEESPLDDNPYHTERRSIDTK